MAVIKIIASILWIISAIFWCYCFYKWCIAFKKKKMERLQVCGLIIS